MSTDDMPAGGEVPPWDRTPDPATKTRKETGMSIHMVTWPEQVEYLEDEIRLRDRRISELESVLKDAVSGLAYIKERYGALDGVGWERLEEAARAVRSKNTEGSHE